MASPPPSVTVTACLWQKHGKCVSEMNWAVGLHWYWELMFISTQPARWCHSLVYPFTHVVHWVPPPRPALGLQWPRGQVWPRCQSWFSWQEVLPEPHPLCNENFFFTFLFLKFLPCCVGFCHTTVQISRNYTYIPSISILPPLPIPPL